MFSRKVFEKMQCSMFESRLRRPCVFFAVAGIVLFSQPTTLMAMAQGEANPSGIRRATTSMQVEFDARQPGLSRLSVDSLRRSEFRPSALVDPGKAAEAYLVSERDGWVRYARASDPDHAVWEMDCAGDTLRMRSRYVAAGASKDITWKFDPNVVHATLLGHVTASGDIALPAVLHLPGMGSLRVYASGSETAALHYDARRAPTAFVTVTFPAATAEHRLVEYSLQTAAIFPAVPGLKSDDRRFDGFRRDFLDIFQQHAEMHVLANHAASDACAFTLYEYGDMARYTPELVKGLTALDLVRESLNRYLSGFLGYGMPGYKGFDADDSGASQEPYVFLDTYPSLLIAAYDYADGSKDDRWLRQNYKGLRTWADTLTKTNADGSPLQEYPASGDSGSWPEKIAVRPSNWWDTIGFGHQDAYANALAYRALRSMAALAEQVGETADAVRYRKRAQEIHDAYAGAFLDRAAGVLAGWRSRDGKLHNYYFPFVNGIAVRYGLIDAEQSRTAMNQILTKMDEVGYTNFELGLPGNLVPIRREDYVDLDPRFGGPKLADGSDGFQKYENGGATACFAYFTLAALYQLGEKEKGDRMLMPMLDAFEKQGFSGRAENGMTYDWKDWHGGANGYEGFLVDNYYALLAVLDRSGMMAKMP